MDFEEDYVEVSQSDYNNWSADQNAKCSTKVDSKTGKVHYLCDGWYNQPKQQILNKVSDWLSHVSAAGTPIIYTRSNYWDLKIGSIGQSLLATYPVWLANYPNPSTFSPPGRPSATNANKWGIPTLPQGLAYPSGSRYSSQITWQFSPSGIFPDRKAIWPCQNGFSGTVDYPDMDMDWFPSTMADFKAAFGLH
jgi:hypothetical protein